MIIGLLVGQLLLTVLGVAAVTWWAVRRLGTGAAIWWIGGATWVVSQILRQPLVGGVQLAGAGAAVVAITAVVSSGVFEEGARYVALRWVVRRARTVRHGIVFGLGHGGGEAVLLIGLAAVSSIVLLAGGQELVDGVAAAGPEAVDAITAQLDALEELTAGTVLLGVYERALAIVAHVAMTLLVLRAVCTRELRWLAAAAGFHILVNGVVVALATAVGIVAAEVGLTVLAVGAVAIIRAAWRDQAEWFPSGDPALEPTDGAT